MFVHAARWRSFSPGPSYDVKSGRGLGLRIGDLIQVDVGITREGIKQVRPYEESIRGSSGTDGGHLASPART